VVPTNGYLDYLTAYATGQARPTTSTLNSLDGRIIANAAIVPAGSSGSINIYASDETDVIIDIDGYFAPPVPGGLAFFPVAPCRVVSTQFSGASQPFGISGVSPCPSMPSAAAYSLNVTAIPSSQQQWFYLTIWPAGPNQPSVSTLNSSDGAGVSNTALVAAGAGGAVDVYVYSQATVYLDVNGYFAPLSSAPGGELFYPVTPCRVADTRSGSGFTGSFGWPNLYAGSWRSFPIPSSACGVPSYAQDYSFNLTVIPSAVLNYLTALPTVQPQPAASTWNLTSTLEKIVADAALVEAGSQAGYQGAISVYPTGNTDLVIDVNGYFAAPTIGSLSPGYGPAGTAVTISGGGFGSSQGTGTVTFNGTGASVTSWSATSISVTVPSYATTGNVVVTVGGQPSVGALFTVTPWISSLSLNSGPVFTAVTINGYTFGASQGTSTVTFNDTGASVTSWSATSIGVTVPSGATAGNVVVTVGGQPSNGKPFAVTPWVSGLLPNSGPVGTPVTINGYTFGSSQGGSTVAFNGTPASASHWSSTSITATVPNGATSGNVVVTVGGYASEAGINFNVTVAGPALRTGINLWNIPIDVYQSTNSQGGFLVIPDSDCPGTAIIQSCVQQYLASWQSQGVSTVRFFVAMTMPMDYPTGNFFSNGSPNVKDGNYSHPWLYNNNDPIVQPQWLANLQAFFADVKNHGMSISPTLSFDPSGPYLYDSANQVLDCAGSGFLMFYPWLPWGFEQSNGPEQSSRDDDGKGINTCYAGGSPPPARFWWGWVPFESLFTEIVKAASAQYGVNVPIQEVDIMQERNLYYFPIQARLIYDNQNNFGVLGFIRSTLSANGFSSGVATFSGGAVNTIQGFDCGSIYGDSAMLILTSEITGAIAGYTYGGLFGVPNPDNEPNGLACYESGQVDTWMVSLPPGVGYTQPSVVDIHAYPCNINPNALPSASSNCDTTDATQNAETLYSDVWTFLWNRWLTGATMIFGESSVVGWNTTPSNALPTDQQGVDPCPWQASPSWAVNGYANSTLSSNHGSATVFMPFNVLANGCYINPVTLSPPYD